jgi:Ca2+-binding EF-hand superfamily protein
MVEAM